MKRFNAIIIFIVFMLEIIYPFFGLSNVFATESKNNPNEKLDVAGPKITFTFDDGYADLPEVKKVFDKYGYKACSAIITNHVGSADTKLTANEIKDFYNDGWEIMSHSASHSASWTNLTESQMDEECKDSKEFLQKLGINVRGLVLPNIVVPDNAKPVLAKYYDYAFGSPSNDIYSISRTNYGSKDFNTIKSEIQSAIKNKKWLVYFAHYTENLEKKPKTGKWYKHPDLDLNILDQTLSYIKSLDGQIEVVLPRDVIKTGIFQDFNSTEVKDTNSPIVTFSPTGNDKYQQIQSTKVTVIDKENNLDNNSLKYLWKKQGESKPNESEFKINFENNAIISSNFTGNNVLWILAKDIAGNTTIISSNNFNVDNDIPDAPEVKISSGVEYWTNEDVIIEVNGSNSKSGIQKYQISLDNGNTWYDYDKNEKLNIKEEGIKNFMARAISNTGKIGVETDCYKIKIDKTKPNIIGIANEGIYSNSVTPNILDNNGKYNTNSGICNVILTKNSFEVENYKIGDKIEGIGKYVIIAYDYAGNKKEMRFEIKAQDKINTSDMLISMQSGWNLGCSLDIQTEQSTYETSINPYTTKEMIDEIKNKGFKTIRIPASWDYHVDEDYNINEEYLNRVQEIVDYGIKNDMYVILDMHHPKENQDGSSWCDPTKEKEQEALKIIEKYWTQIAEKFKNYGNNLIFETLNEPRKRDCLSEDWADEWTGKDEYYNILNNYNAKAIETIRKVDNNVNRLILIPTYANSADVQVIQAVKIPENSGNVAVAIHAYTPNTFTFMDSSKNEFTDEVKESLTSLFSNIKENLIDKNVPVVITEYGVTNKVNENERIKYVNYYVEQAKKLNIPCLWWDNGKIEEPLNDSFGIFDRKNLEWKYVNLVDAIIDKHSVNEAPVIEGVVDKFVYKTDVSINVIDEDLLKVTLTKNDVVVPYKLGDKITENGVYVLVAEDKGGNRSQVSFTILKENFEEISVVFEPNENLEYKLSQKTNVKINSKNYLDSSKLKYVWMKENSIPSEETFEANGVNFSSGRYIEKFYGNGQYCLWIRVEDLSGSVKYFNSGKFAIDTFQPYTPTVIGNRNVDKWSNEDYIVSISGGNSLCGIDRYEFSIDEGNTWNSFENDKYVITNEGINKIRTRAVNNLGKISSETVDIVVKIDKQKPEIKGIENNNSYFGSVIPEISDDLSGIKKCELIKDGQIVQYEIGTEIVENGSYILKVVDNAGNENNVQFSINAPQEIKAMISYSTYEETEKAVIASISFNLPDITIINNNGSNDYEFTENGTFTFEYKDQNGKIYFETAKVDWIKKTNNKSEEIKNDNDNKIEETKKDNNKINEKKQGEETKNTSVMDKILPNAGLESFVLILIVLIVNCIFTYVRYKRISKNFK